MRSEKGWEEVSSQMGERGDRLDVRVRKREEVRMEPRSLPRATRWWWFYSLCDGIERRKMLAASSALETPSWNCLSW